MFLSEVFTCLSFHFPNHVGLLCETNVWFSRKALQQLNIWYQWHISRICSPFFLGSEYAHMEIFIQEHKQMHIGSEDVCYHHLLCNAQSINHDAGLLRIKIK